MHKKLKAVFNGHAENASDTPDTELKRSWYSFYDDGVPFQISIPDCSIVDFLQAAVTKDGNKIFINYFNKKIIYAEFYNCVQDCAKSLQKLGIDKDDRVAILMPNIPQFLVVYWAVLYLGAIAVLINPLHSEREINEQIIIVGPKAVFVLDVILEKMRFRLYGIENKNTFVASIDSFFPPMKKLAYQLTQSGSWKSKLKADKNKAVAFRELLNGQLLEKKTIVSGKDSAVMLFTGGVTGTPKATVLSHKNLIANTLQGLAWMKPLNIGNEIILGALPFIHSYGMTASHHLAVFSCSTLSLQPRFNVRKIVRDIKNMGVTILPGVPTMFQALLNRENPPDLTSIKLCISGGAAISKNLQDQFLSKTGLSIVQGYGLTEAAPITHCNPIYGKKVDNSIGLPWPNTDAKIIDTKSGKQMPPLKPGELLIKGPQVMLGYWNNPDETKNVNKNGWLSTGDIAYYDENGYFYIVDRIKDVILSGGANIYPAEVEGVLKAHPAIDEVSVIGVEDDFLGQIVKAFIVKKENKKIDLENIVLFCEGKLAKYKIPQKVEIRERLPKNFLGKILKRELY